MADIKHKLAIKTKPEIVYNAITSQEGLSGWWSKQTTAKPEIGFINIFVFGQFRNELKVTKLVPHKMVEWECIQSIEEWIGTYISFELEEKDEHTILRFSHGGWKAVTDTFAGSNFDWGRFMVSLKLFCETGTGTPS